MDKALSLKERYAEHMKLQIAFPTCRKVMQEAREKTARESEETYSLMKQVLLDKHRAACAPQEIFKVDPNSSIPE